MNPSGRRHTGPFFARTPWSCVAEWPYYSVNVVVEGFGSIHGNYVEPGEPIDTVGAPEDLQAGAERVIAASRQAGLINTLYSGPAMAASLPLSPIRAVTKAKGGKLYIERTMLRERIAATKGFQGITGEPSCDPVGVCGRSRMTIALHTDSSVTVLAQVPVVCHAAL